MCRLTDKVSQSAATSVIPTKSLAERLTEIEAAKCTCGLRQYTEHWLEASVGQRRNHVVTRENFRKN